MTEQHLFIARQDELTALSRGLESMLRGRGQLYFVAGSAGAGKSTLVTEFERLAQLEHSDLLIATGVCDAQTGLGDPYLPFKEILGFLTGTAETSPGEAKIAAENISRLRRTLTLSLDALLEFGPDLINLLVPGASLVAIAGRFVAQKAGLLDTIKNRIEKKSDVSSQADGPVNQDQVLEQTINVLLRLSKAAPLVLVLDDLQWADEASINLFFRLARRLENSRILLIGTYRPEEIALGRRGERHPLEKVLTESKRYYGDIWIDLEQSNRAKGQFFVDACLDQEPNQLSPAFRAAFYAHTGGHPLFVVELLSELQSKGYLVKDTAGRWSEGPAIDWRTLPKRVEGILEERFLRLPGNLQETLQVASVEGVVFTAEVLARVLSLEPRDLIRQLSGELQKNHHLVESQDVQYLETQRLSRYRFSNQLMQMYLYHQLDEIERSYHHESVGITLENLYANQARQIAVQLAWHFDQAGMVDKALPYLQAAGEQAAAVFANETAMAYFDRALELAHQADPGFRYQLHSGREKIYDMLGNRAAQNQELEKMAHLAVSSQNPHQQAEVKLLQGKLALNTGEYQLAIQTAQDAVQLLESLEAPTAGTTRLLADGFAQWGQALRLRGDSSGALAKLEHSLALARQSGYARGEITTLERIGVCQWSQGNFSTARETYAQALALAQDTGDLRLEWSLLNNLGLADRELGNTTQALQAYQRALEIARSIGDRKGQNNTLINLGEVYLTVGDYESALEYTHQALDLTHEIGERKGLGITLLNLGDIYNKLGDYAQALSFTQQALEVLEEINFRMGAGIALGNLGEAYAGLQDYAAAKDCVQRSLVIAQEVKDQLGQALQLNQLGELELIQNNLEAARTAYQAAHDLWLNLEQTPGLWTAQTALGWIAQQAAHSPEQETALSTVQPILEQLLNPASNPPQENIPLKVYYTSVQLLMTWQDPRAQILLNKAHEMLHTSAERIHNPALQKTFLENIPVHAEINRLYTAAEITARHSAK
jgi:adenylate cyclase